MSWQTHRPWCNLPDCRQLGQSQSGYISTVFNSSAFSRIVFDPSLMDQAAAGDIDAVKPDPEIIKAAHALPINQFGWWASGNGSPPSMAQSTQIPRQFTLETVEPLGTPLPWEEREMGAPSRSLCVILRPQRILESHWVLGYPRKPLAYSRTAGRLLI
jgi:hypothetical protein